MLELLGIGLGKMEIQLERYAFLPGDRVVGKARFRLKEATYARGVYVGIRAMQRVLMPRPDSRGRLTLEYRSDVVYSFTQQLAPEGVYGAAEYGFELVIPSNVLGSQRLDPPPGTLGDIARALAFLSSHRRFPPRWQVFAHLDLPWKIDVKKRVDITLSEFVRAN